MDQQPSDQMMTSNTSAETKNDKDCLSTRPRKRRFFEFLYDEENDQDTSQQCMAAIPRDKLRKSLDSLQEYRSWLSTKEKRVKKNLYADKRLKEKDDIIHNLRKRTLELESKPADLDPESKCTDHNLNNTQESVAVENLLGLIDGLQGDKDRLQNESKVAKQAERRWASKYWELYESVVEKDEQISRVTFECVEKDARLKKLEDENRRLLKKNRICEEHRSKSVDVMRQEIQNICQQYKDVETEMFEDKLKHLEFMANYKPMVVVENPNKVSIDEDVRDAITTQLNDMKTEYVHLRQRVADIPIASNLLIQSTSLQIQNAIQETNDKYNELLPKYERAIELRKKYHNEVVELRGNIRVLCRIRPMEQTSEEMSDGGTPGSCISTDSFDDCNVRVNNKGRCQDFDFDKVFTENTTQSQVFDEVSSLVTSVLDGFNVCIFAYGQTGAGKTYTMEGPTADPGINQRALKLLFQEATGSGTNCTIEASVLEIYNETIRDLLNSDTSIKLEVKMKPEGGLHVPGLVEIPVTSLDHVNQIFTLGRRNRTTEATNMNEHSSRSHCLLCVTVTGVNKLTGVKSFGRLNLVDLAGSERVSKSMAEGPRLKEAQNINKSLSSLGDVINALKNKHSHVPYRNSKLTYLLQESLSGESKTLMILQVSPEDRNASETVCTLGFGQRVRTIELGAATKRVEDGTGTGKGTPSNLRRGVENAVKTTPTTGPRTPNLTKSASTWRNCK